MRDNVQDSVLTVPIPMSSRIVSFLFLACLQLPALAVEPAPNQTYPGGTRIELPGSGVRFTLPEKLVAVAGDNPEHEFVAGLMPEAASGSSSLYIQIGVGELEAIADEMSRTVAFKGETLYPKSDPVLLEGGIVHNDFELAEGLDAFMLAAVAGNGTALIFLAVAPPEQMPAYRTAVAELVNSLAIELKDLPGSDTASTDRQRGQPASGAARSPLKDIVGAWMRRSNYSNGIYIENRQKWVFAADGRVSWGSGSIVAGGTGNVSLRGGGDNPPDHGRWRIEGDLLTIDWDDGTTGQWRYFVFDYEGTPVLVLKSGGSTYRYRKID